MAIRTLTKKEQMAIEFFLAGDNQTEATMKSYNCKDRHSARSLATRVFNKESVCYVLAERQKMLQNKLANRQIRLIEMIERHIPREMIAKKLADNIMSSDKRVSDSAMEKYLKLAGEYMPERVMAIVKSELLSERQELVRPE